MMKPLSNLFKTPCCNVWYIQFVKFVAYFLVVVLAAVLFVQVALLVTQTWTAAFSAPSHASEAKVSTDTPPTHLPAPTSLTPAASPTLQSTPAKPDADSNAAISTTMTAISTSVGLFAVLLAFGSSWFVTKQKEVENLHEEQKALVEKTTASLKEFQEAQAISRQITQHLTEARYGVLNWAKQSADEATSASLVIEINALLEALTIENRDDRKTVFDRLCNFPFGVSRPDNCPPELQAMKTYTELCHLYHTRHLPDMDPARSHGQWCQIFSAEERRRAAQPHHPKPEKPHA